MSTPAQALLCLGWSCLFGAGLGMVYGFLRPVRPRALADVLFLICLGWAGIYLGFGICQGDLRLGYAAGLLVGGVAWDLTMGRLLRPVWQGFWGIFARGMGAIRFLMQKILKKVKKMKNFSLHMKKNRLQ